MESERQSALLLRQISANEIPDTRRNSPDAETIEAVSRIINDVRREGKAAVLRYGRCFGDLNQDSPLFISRDELERTLRSFPRNERELLERLAERIRAFAEAQKQTLRPMKTEILGGTAGQTLQPVERAGCYAPGGRFPLPSSVLMTAITAKVAGVEKVFVASPRPAPCTLAAAAIAGVDGVLAVGGAQAIAALAFGADIVPAVDVIVGPGNCFVTAAKILLSGEVRIDMPAGPSELLILADSSADPRLIAADLLAQAEHDPNALPMLVTTDPALPALVERELAEQLPTLSTAETAVRALKTGFFIVVGNLEEAISISDRIAPEHLQVMTQSANELADCFKHYGALFLGESSAEVFGDYGAGPNHVRPTGGSARSYGGLSVFQFLRVRTWMCITQQRDSSRLAEDAACLARMEGLEAHARASELRNEKTESTDC